ncbi:MAG: TetR/AcrR family transcriptional regulator [Pseudomonadota bacterium]
MPIVVDHDERRLQVAAVVEQLVYEAGIEGLTIRDVARRAKCSTSVVSHYFTSKLELLIFTHRAVRNRAERRLLDGLEQGRSLQSSIESLLPMSDETWREWHTWFAFWGMAPAEPTVNQEWQAGTADANSIFVRLLEAARQSGEAPADLDPVTGSVKLQVVINGIATLVSQDRAGWPGERQKSLLREMLAATLGIVPPVGR